MSKLQDAKSLAGVDLKSMYLPDLEHLFVHQLDEKPQAALRAFKAIWKDGVSEVDDLTVLKKKTIARLKQIAHISCLERASVHRSTDGTVKYLWRLSDGGVVESVLIPSPDRTTLCVSSQVGCAMKCSFCLTGDLGLIRQMTTAEIADQILQVILEQSGEKRITNLVFMGMGEPMNNLKQLIPALRIALDDNGLGFSKRRLTVSTSGLVPQLLALTQAVDVSIAISLNASTDAQRDQIMPVNRKYPIAVLLDACRKIPLKQGRRITFEYVMIKHFNDSLEDAARVESLLQGIPHKLNLIPYNENPDRAIERPEDSQVKAFQSYFVSRGGNCSVRATRGQDISAACGQLGKTDQTPVEHAHG